VFLYSFGSRGNNDLLKNSDYTTMLEARLSPVDFSWKFNFILEHVFGAKLNFSSTLISTVCYCIADIAPCPRGVFTLFLRTTSTRIKSRGGLRHGQNNILSSLR
jgi:hypothetical protein